MSIQLSFSANQKYIMSPRSYYLHYILRLRPEIIGSALVFGGVVDIGLNALLEKKSNAAELFTRAWTKQNINGKNIDLRHTDLIKYSKADYDENILNQSDLEAIEAGLNPNWVSLHRKGQLILKAYTEQVMPFIVEVIAVQKYVKLKNGEGDSFVGWVDFIAKFDDGKVYIVDNKTTSIKYKDNSVRESAQLATYFEAAKEDNIKADGAAYITIPKKFRKKKEPLIPIQIIKDNINEELIETTFQEYDNTLHGIKMGEFPCTGCADNPFGCSYKKYCESDGKNLEGLIYVKKEKN